MKILIFGLHTDARVRLLWQKSYLITSYYRITMLMYTGRSLLIGILHTGGRERQAFRMSRQWGILDFVCPTNEFRNIVNPDYTIFMNTIHEGRFEDTNKLFEQPISCDCEIKKWIEPNQLRNSLADFNRGIDLICIQNFLKERLNTL